MLDTASAKNSLPGLDLAGSEFFIVSFNILKI
jgi:hypothetical protein